MNKPFKITANRHNAKIWFTKWWAEIGLFVEYDKDYLFARILNPKMSAGLTTFHHYIEHITPYQEYTVNRFKTFGFHFEVTVFNITFRIRVSPFVYWKEK